MGLQPCALSADHHYQLANRLASAWKLSSLGLQVALVYLGFIGDEYFPDCFVDANHWMRTIGACVHGVVPLTLPGRRLSAPCGGLMTLSVRARLVVAPSSPRHQGSRADG